MTGPQWGGQPQYQGPTGQQPAYGSPIPQGGYPVPPAPPGKGNSQRIWWIVGGAALLVAVIVTAVTMMSGSSSKPDITTITTAMLLTENELPAIDGGEYQMTGVKVADGDDSSGPDCENGAPAAGDQVGSAGTLARVKGAEDPMVGATLLRTSTPWDLSNCSGRVDIPDLPDGVTAIQRGDHKYVALGYVRGVLIAAVAAGEDDRQVKMNLVDAYKRQADKLKNS